MSGSNFNECEFAARVQNLHDGALDEVERARVLAHVSSCPACAAELAALTKLSALLAQVKPISHGFNVVRAKARLASARLKKIAQDNRWRIVRVGQWMTAAAAAIMVTCGAALWSSDATAQNPNPSAAGPNKGVPDLTVAVTSPDDLLNQTDTEKALMLAVGYGSEQP